MELEQKIERYLNMQLSPEEMASFESEIAADDTLKKEVEYQQMALQALQIKGAQAIKSMLKNHELEKKSSIKRLYKYALALFLIAMVLVYYVYQASSKESGDVVLANYFTPYKNPITLRGDEQTDSPWLRGVAAYSSSDFERAAKEFSSITSNEIAPSYLVDFYHAVALLAQDNQPSAEAIDLLTELIEGEHDYVQQSRWYLALAYLRSADQQKAKELLDEIVENKQYKHVEAEQLRKSMSKVGDR